MRGVNYTVHMDTLAAIFALIYGSSPTVLSGRDVLVSFAPCAWHGLRPVSEL